MVFLLWMEQITLVRVPYTEKSIHHKLQWLGLSLGLFGERDKDKSCFRIFIELLKAAKQKSGLSSDELAQCTKLSRGTVVHHLNRLLEAGIVKNNRNTYALRADSLQLLIEELQRDTARTLDVLAKVAKELDTALGI